MILENCLGEKVVFKNMSIRLAKHHVRGKGEGKVRNEAVKTMVREIDIYLGWELWVRIL